MTPCLVCDLDPHDLQKPHPTYGIGHCSVIVLAGTSTGLVQKYLHWNEKSKRAVILKRTCGVLVLAGGVYLIYMGKRL